MDHTIYMLNARIDFLESQILSLLSSHSYTKKKRNSGFHLFAQHVRHHVRSYLFKINFDSTGNPQFTPSNIDIIKEISTMWNDINDEEKSHWARLT